MNVIPDIYQPPLGLPLYWMDEQSGKMREAVQSLFGFFVGEADAPDAATIELLRQYLEHFVYAPCWEQRSLNTCDENYSAALTALRTKVKGLKTASDIRAWLGEAFDISLDPF